MPKKDVSISVESSGFDMMQGLAKFVAAVKAAHANGANLMTAIPADISAAIADLAPLVGEVSQLKPDMAEDKLALIKGLNLGAYDIANALMGQ